MDNHNDKELLIRQLGSTDHAATRDAIKALRRRGWLEDGTLRGVHLPGANLSDANLIGADLQNSILGGADLSYARLSRANLSGADLDGANLRGANLHRTTGHKMNLLGADLSYANLSGADLRSANLYNASLYRANGYEGGFQEAHFSHANLHGADFQNANLNRADLSHANLQQVNLTRAFLNQADFTRTQCSGTNFTDIDLSTVIGLESVQHEGPSHLAIDTIYHSRGRIPGAFLRGCGVPEEMILYLPNLIGKTSEFYSCFISYSHADKAFARRVHDTLQSRGIRCWLDEKQMNPGDDIYEEIGRGIRLWDKVLLCCSQSSLAEKWWVDHEMDIAFQKERELFKTRGHKVLALIPLDLDGFLFNEAFTSGKAQQIRSRVAANFKGWEHDPVTFDREIERLIRALKTDGGKETPPPSRL
ncbi:MAG: toll/interleukin-1 receptor domain-containing protein [Anaerolineae bacterium]|nr:toll/interleukin-1 receptor domain-containing protein [Anaerolineae bacterium]